MSLTKPTSEPSAAQLLYQIAAKTGISLGHDQILEIMKDVSWTTASAQGGDDVIHAQLELNVTTAEKKREAAAALRLMADMIDASAGRA